MSDPTTETGLALAAVYFGGKYMWELGQDRVWTATTVPTVGPETYLEIVENLQRRQGLAVTHHGGKEPDKGGPRKFFFNFLFYFLNFF